MRMYLSILISILLYCALPSNAQPQYKIKHYDEFSGMAQWWVTQIVQDQHGMLWFATWNGLNRYDGYQFECFKPQPGDGIDMPSDRIADIIIDKDGNLLCYVDERVFRFDVNTCKYQAIDKQLEKHMAEVFSQRHKLLSAKPNTPYILYNGNNEQITVAKDVKPENSSMYCTTDKENNIWFRSDYGAYRLTPIHKPYTMFPQEHPGQIRSFYLDRQQRYWVTGRDDKSVRIFDKGNNLLGYLGSDGKIHDKYTPFVAPIYHLMQDSKGIYWLCSKPDGLFRVREQQDGSFQIEQFKHIASDKRSINDNDIYYAAEDSHGRLWIATFNGGINCCVNPQDEKPVFLHKDNKLNYPVNDGQKVRQLHITDDNKLLAATTGGLIVADISSDNASEITFHIHKKDANRSNSLSNNATMFVAEDTKHRIFICTESGGINQIISKNLLSSQLDFKYFNVSTGMPSDVALSAIPWDDGLLIVSNNQLIRLNPDNCSTMNHTAYFRKERLRFSDAKPIQLPDGRWIFGLQDGAFTIHTKDIRKSGFVPPLVLTGLSVCNSMTNPAVVRLDTLSLAPHERGFTIHFAALSYSGNDNISYAFQMGEDNEQQWNYIGKNHSATFLNLHPGTYTLKIRSTNNDGVWVDNTRTLTVIVKPTFWETIWAKLLYIALFIFAAWIIIRIRQKFVNLYRRQHELHEAYLALLNANQTTVNTTANEVPATATKPCMKPEDEAFMQQAIRFIEQHIGDPDINIGDMAEATATSRSGLNRKMKSLLGVTPLDFIREARIRKACLMLKTGVSVNEVAYKCGYSDPKYFGRCFKSETGMTPTEFKAKNKTK